MSVLLRGAGVGPGRSPCCQSLLPACCFILSPVEAASCKDCVFRSVEHFCLVLVILDIHVFIAGSCSYFAHVLKCL